MPGFVVHVARADKPAFAEEAAARILMKAEVRPHLSQQQRPERALRGFVLGRKAWLFAGSERGAERAAAMATLIMTAKLNGVDPLAWLADVLARIAAMPQSRLHELLPWEWKQPTLQKAA
jgi:hypothetical protein